MTRLLLALGLVVLIGPRAFAKIPAAWLDVDPAELRALESQWRSDPAKACRRPAAYEYLRISGRLFGPPVDRLCPNFTLLSERGEAIDFDFAKLFEIQYVVAGRGEQFASRFGHTMLRFVFCAPERGRVDASCREDEFDAVDVGFVAHTDTQTFSVVGGVTGRYPSWLTATPDSDLRHRYLDQELRELVAAPLKLDEESRRMLFALVVERHWSYEGRYKFLSNNCADEVLHMIQASVPANHPLVTSDPRVVRPRGLLDELRKVDLLGEETFTWPSRRPLLEARLRELNPDHRLRSVDRYVAAPAALRLDWVRGAESVDAALLTALEDVAAREARAHLVKSAVHALYETDTPPACDVGRDELRSGLEARSIQIAPSNLKRVGARDIPRPDEVVDSDEVAARYRTLDAQIDTIIACFRLVPSVAAAQKEVNVGRQIERLLNGRL